MWSTLPLPWHTCLEEAWTAYCAGAIPIGAAITDPTGTILARGRNRVFSNTAPTQRPHGNPLAHAEMHAFERLDWDNIDPHDCILYTTTEPCPLCFGALYMSGLRELHYAARDTYAGSTDLLGITPYLRRKPIRIHGPADPHLEAIIVALHVEFSLHTIGPARAQPLLDAWQTTAPTGVTLGRTLHHTGHLRHLRSADTEASVLVEELGEHVAM
ncbi:MAG: nucleoside deaminase [Thermomicrobiales bacterium]